MDEQLEEIAASLLGQRLPNDWRKFAPDTCMALAEWLDHLQVLELNRTNVCLCLHGPLFWGCESHQCILLLLYIFGFVESCARRIFMNVYVTFGQ